MNAPTPPQAGREILGCIAKREPDAEFAWSSKRRLQVLKGDQNVNLSADDLRALFNFVEACTIAVQL